MLTKNARLLIKQKQQLDKILSGTTIGINTFIKFFEGDTNLKLFIY